MSSFSRRWPQFKEIQAASPDSFIYVKKLANSEMFTWLSSWSESPARLSCTFGSLTTVKSLMPISWTLCTNLYSSEGSCFTSKVCIQKPIPYDGRAVQDTELPAFTEHLSDVNAMKRRVIPYFDKPGKQRNGGLDRNSSWLSILV